MSTAPSELTKPVIFGRSSSHFTRVTRIFAAELRVDYSFVVVRDLMSSTAGDYAGNPALKLPALETTLQGTRAVWFGALNICRELSRQSSLRPRIVWPEDLEEPLLANAQELVLAAMATNVALIMGKISGIDESNAHHAKMRKSLIGTMSWLEDNTAHLCRALPADRDVSFLEVTLFCLITHLEFRDVIPMTSYPELNRFGRDLATRSAMAETPYRFDA